MTRWAGILRAGLRRAGSFRISFAQGFVLAWTLIFGGAMVAGADSESTPNTAIALEALSRLKGIDLATNPGVRAAVQKVLQQVRGRPEFLEIVRDFQLLDQDPGLVEVAAKNPRDSSGVEAARLLVEHHSLDLLKEGFRSTNAVNLIEALGHARVKQSVPLLEPIVTDGGLDLVLRQEAIRALAQVREGVVVLLTLVRDNKLPAELRPTATAELNSVRWPELKAEAARTLPLPQPLQSNAVPTVAALIKRRGDAARGRDVFRREVVGCLRCHQINGQGVDFGPNLSEIGSKLGPDALYQAILEPSAGISFGYEAWQMEMKNGDEVYGLVSSETDDEVVVKSLGGIVSKYKKSAIARRTQQKLSVMPSGLEQAMSVEDLVDLVEYLGSLKKR